MTTDPEFPIPNVPESNARFDAQYGNPYELTRIRCGWNESQMMRRGELTDRRIEHWKRKGFYGDGKPTTKPTK